MDIRVGELHNVCMAQTRKGTENEDHQFQFLDRSDDTARKHIADTGKIDDEFFDKAPLQLLEKHIFYLIFVFRKGGEATAGFVMVFEGRNTTVLAYTLAETHCGRPFFFKQRCNFLGYGVVFRVR